MDCATMRSDVIGDFQEPCGAVLVKRADMTALVSRNGHYGISRPTFSDQSGLAPENSTTLPHFSVSSAMSFPKSADEPGSSEAPKAPQTVPATWDRRESHSSLC